MAGPPDAQERVTFITPELSIHKRLLVHFAAHCSVFSHTSIGKGAKKRILLSRLPIGTTSSSGSNSRHLLLFEMRNFCVDPTIICMDFFSAPSKMVIAYQVKKINAISTSIEQSVSPRKQESMLTARYATVEDALAAKFSLSENEMCHKERSTLL
jgi:hypothetical protein